MQHVEACGASGLEDMIIEACVSCVAYDPQGEAARAPWLFSMVEQAKLHATVMQAIEATIQEPPPENHGDLNDMNQRSAILKELAAAGSDDARRLLYASLVRLPHTADVIGAEQIVALDGVEGLIRVARQLGRWLLADPDFWVDDWLIAQVDASTENVGGLAALQREAGSDSDIARYLAGIRRTREGQSASSTRFDATAYTGARIVEYVDKHPKDQCHWFRWWGAQAASDQREAVFAALLASDEPGHVQRLFKCFAKTGVLRFDSRLLRWITHADGSVREAAVQALALTHHVELRQAAMRLMTCGDTANGVALLMNNFETGDFALCAAQLKRLDDADEAHYLVEKLLDLCEAHPGADALDGLLYVYEFSPCSTCRRRAVKALVDSRIAPGWVLAECAFDADPGTRALVGADGSAG